MHIANTLSSYFISENLKIREAQASGTSDFLEDELDLMRGRLEGVENSLREYRSRYMGELPGQLQTNLSIINTLQKQLDEKRERMREEKRRLSLLAAEIEEERNYIGATGTAVGTEPGEALTIGQLKAQLAALRSSYTDRHPDVIRLKSKIADLEAASGISGSIGSDTSPRGSNGEPEPTIASTALREKIRRHTEIKVGIDTIAKDIGRINRQLGSYQQRVERTPKREEELMSLKRDYENIQDSYNSLLNRQLEAEIAVNMEKKQKGEQFRIIDQARLPQKPISPNLKRFFLLSVAAGLGIGGGLIFLLDFLNTSLKEPKDYETQLGLTVLATIPKLYGPRDKMLRHINRGLTAISLVVAAALTAGFGLLVVKGVDTTIEIVREFAKL
jgi:polysaccharide chain length determinant protein (PEP-CTERM system associated)